MHRSHRQIRHAVRNPMLHMKHETVSVIERDTDVFVAMSDSLMCQEARLTTVIWHA